MGLRVKVIVIDLDEVTTEGAAQTCEEHLNAALADLRKQGHTTLSARLVPVTTHYSNYADGRDYHYTDRAILGEITYDDRNAD